MCAAIVRKLRTGEGERIDVAMSDVLATWTGAVTPTAAGVDSSAQGGVPGYGIFATADGGHVTLGIISEDHFWRALCDALGLDDARDLGFLERMPQQAALQDRIAGAIRRRQRDELVDELLAAGVPAAPALSRAEMLALAAHARTSCGRRRRVGDAGDRLPSAFRAAPRRSGLADPPSRSGGQARCRARRGPRYSLQTFVVETAPEPPRTRRRYVAGVAAAAFAILFLGIPSASSTVADPHRCDFLSKGSRDRGDCLAADDTAVALNQASCAVAAGEWHWVGPWPASSDT